MYLIKREKARTCLSETYQKIFDDIVYQRVLGASTHIKMIGDMIEDICIQALSSNGKTEHVIKDIEELTNYFIHTRGEASQAITNAIYVMIQGLHEHVHKDVSQAVHDIIETKDQYHQKAKAASELAVGYAIEIGNRMERILVFDYSSSVEAFLRNIEGEKLIYIAESRIINGGKPFVKACVERGHKVHFIPDASLMYYMKDCDGVFMGAETLLPDGTGYNTTGSDIVGVLCDYYKIPLYFISPLIKTDIRPVFGKEKPLVFNDLKEKLQEIADPENIGVDIDYLTPELVGVAPQFIRAFITEKGVIPSGAMYEVCMNYMKDLKGGL